MQERIVYENDEGGFSVITPASCGLSVKEIADKDVPTGKPYKIVSANEIPENRGDWDFDASTFKDGVGA